MSITNGTAHRALVDEILPKLPSLFALTPLVNKKPLRHNWQHETPLDRSTLTNLMLNGEELQKSDGSTWHCKYTGIGLRLGEISGGLVAIDHDGSSATQLIEQLSGMNIKEALPPTVGMSSGKLGRYQLLYQVPSCYWNAIAPKKIATGIEGEQLEFRWNGQQSVLAGRHPETGAYYFLPNNAPWEIEIALCPQWIIEQMLLHVPFERRTTWRQFEREFKLPINETVPITVCLSHNSRDILDSKLSKGRNDSGAALSRDLIGAANYLDSIGQRYDGDPKTIFEDWCRQVGLDKDKPANQPETIWRSSEKSNPQPSLPPDYIEGCIKSWAWQQLWSSSRQSQRLNNSKQESAIADALRAAEKSATPIKRAKLAERHDEIKAAIGDRVRLNVLSQSIELDGKRMSLDEIQIDLALSHNLDVSDNAANKIIPMLAKQNLYNPFVEYLQAVHAKHGNSGAVLLNSIAANYMGAVENLYQIYTKRTLIGCVARAMQPGCKLDTALILNGNQGYLKSSFFEKLLPNPDWFDDSMGDINNKDELLKIHRACILEWPELEVIFNRRGHSQIKSFLATKVDRIRVPYGRNLEDYARHSIIVGTTNQPEFLTDPTGDRRYWVVPVRQRIDIKRLETERDLLWAATFDAYLRGEQWWLTDAEQQESAVDNENYRTEHPWTTAITSFVEFKTEVTTNEILMQIKPDIGTQSKGDQMVVADILTSLGWCKTKITRCGRRIKGWKRLSPPVTTCHHPGVGGGDTLKQPPINTSNAASPPVTTFLQNKTLNDTAAHNLRCHTANQPVNAVGEQQIVINPNQVVTGGDSAQNSITASNSEVSPPQIEVERVGTGGDIFKVGDRVYWDKCPTHCAWANPFTITRIESDNANLDIYSELVPVSELRLVES